MASADTSDDNATFQAIHFTVGRICEEVGGELGVTFKREVIATIADIVKSQLSLVASDLVAFAKHAKRAVISADDVKLLVRRNPQLREYIATKAEQWENEALGGRERKKRASKSKKGIPLNEDRQEEVKSTEDTNPNYDVQVID